MSALLVGYARCSTDAQDLTAQRDALATLGVSPERISVDHGLTGTNRERPGLREALAACRAGDTLVVREGNDGSGLASAEKLRGARGTERGLRTGGQERRDGGAPMITPTDSSTPPDLKRGAGVRRRPTVCRCHPGPSWRDPGVTHEETHLGTTRGPHQARGRRPPRRQAADLHKHQLHRVPAGQELSLKQDGCCAHRTALSRRNGLPPGLLWG